jgi:hypothetical protein
MKWQRHDPALGALLRAIRDAGGAPMVVLEAESTPWASVTFSGARHQVGLRFDGAGGAARAEAWARMLGAAEFDLPGHLVADVAEVSLDGEILRFSALTVVDA